MLGSERPVPREIRNRAAQLLPSMIGAWAGAGHTSEILARLVDLERRRG